MLFRSVHYPKDDTGHSMNDDCNYGGNCPKATLTPKEEKSIRHQSACEYLGLPGTLCMNHLWNFKTLPQAQSKITINADGSLSASTEESNGNGESGLPGGKGSESKKSRISRAQKFFDTLEEAFETLVGLNKKRGVAAELTTKSGSTIASYSHESSDPNAPEVQEALDAVPQDTQSNFHGNCGEIHCLNESYRRGVDPSGGTMRTVDVKTGMPRQPCSSCQHVLDSLDVTWRDGV